MEANLYPFQVEGVRDLVGRRCVLLADEMGLGKTIQAAVALRKLFDESAILRVLIVCPVSLCHNWKYELGRWGNLPAVIYHGSDRFGMLEGDAPVLVGSYETVASDLRRQTDGGRWFHDIGLDVLVLDEAQRVKAPDAGRSRILSKLVASRRWAITGTPMENHPRELASILRFLYPNEFESDGEINDAQMILAYRDRAMLRRTKAQVGLQLPPKTVARVPVALAPEQQAEYVRARNAVAASLEQAGTRSSATMCLLHGLQELRRIAVVSTNGESCKLDLIAEELGEIVERGEKAVVFSSFANLALPEFAARLSPYGSLLYTGSMSSDQRLAAHDRFLHDPDARVMCASLRAAGVGLTWTVASHVYHTDPWWNPQVLNQADDRVHRIGQTKPVFIKRLIAENTIESAVEDLLTAKEDIFDFVVGEHPLDSANSHSFEQLLSLIGLKLSALSLAQ